MKKEKLTPRTDLVEKRKAAGLSQAKIGELAKLPQTYVSRFEIGKSLPDENVAALTAVYDKLDPAPEGETKPAKDGEKAPKMKRKARSVKQKAAAAAEDVDDGPEDEGYDDCMKPAAIGQNKHRGEKKAPAPDDPDPSSRSFDAERLKAVVRAFVADKDLSIHESGRSGARHVMVPPDDLFELGQVVLRNAGIRVGGT